MLFNSNTLGQMISVSGAAICISDVVQLLVGMEFRCSKCGKIHFAKMPFPGILSYPSTKHGDFEDATFSVPTSVRDTNTLGKWRAEIERLATAQTQSLHRQLMPYPRRALLHAKAADSADLKISNFNHKDSKCECIQRNKHTKLQGKFIPLPHRSVYVDAQIFKVRERHDEEEESYTEVQENSSKGKKKNSSTASSAPATAGSIDVLIVGERSVVPSLSPGTIVTVTGALTVANAVMELLKRGGAQKRIGQSISSVSNMPDIQHHPGDFTVGPKTVILMGSYVEIHKTTFQEEAPRMRTQQLSPPGASFFEQCTFQNKRTSTRIERMSECIDLEQLLLNSFCPGIIGHTNIKRAILMCAVSDEPAVGIAEPAVHCEKLFNRSFRTSEGSSNARGSAIHLLILGPAGIGKSQLLKFASSSLFRSVYLCGPTLTPTGLGVGWSAQTSHSSSSATSHARLEAGALIVADGGLSCIDEIDKMSISAQNVLYEVIDQGTLTVSKAAVLHTVETSTRVIAAGNIENLGCLSPDLLSRFSLTFCIPPQTEGQQDQSKGRDEQTARRALLMSVLGSTGPVDGDRVPSSQAFEATATEKSPTETVPIEALRAYLHHLRRKCRLRLTLDAKSVLKEWYIAQRSQSTCTQDGFRKSSEARTSPRKLGSVFEMTCCLAKIRGKNIVEASDVEDVILLVTEAESSTAASSRLHMMRSRESGGKRTRKNAMAEIFRNYLHKQKLSADKQQWSELELQESYETCFQNDIAQSSQQVLSFPRLLEILNEGGVLLKSSHSKYRMP